MSITARLASLKRRSVILLASALLYLSAMTTQAAGFDSIEVPAGVDGPALVGAIWYPCSQEAGEIDLGTIAVRGTKGCAIRGDDLPLIAISHGNLGAFFDHHDTAEALADAGFIVAAINHRGDNTPNFPDGADPSVMIGRPADIKRLIDFMLAGSTAAARIDPKRIGFFGFSAGAYTGLVLTGAEPEWAVVMCRFSSAPRACVRILESELLARPRAPEPRIKAAVLADPPGMWLGSDGVASVRVPIQLWASETGGRGLPNVLVKPEDVAAIHKKLPERHEYHVVPNAGHFAFMLCGPSIKAIPEFCTDAPGFDRAAFHKRFNAEVVRFFRAQLGE